MPNTDVKLDFSGFKGGTFRIPKGVTSIPPYEFLGIDGLEKVIIPDTVREIGDCAFVGRDSLREVIMKGEQIRLASRAFDECANLEKVTLPKYTEEIPEAAFKGCSSLKEIVLPQEARQIAAHAFYRCHSLEHITLPNGLKLLGYGAFRESGLTSIEIPEDAWEIGEYAFSGCNSLREVTMKGERIRLSFHAFEGCTNLEKITLPRQMMEIQRATFKDCSKLQHIDLPDTVESIEEYAFSGCTSLESIIIPKNIKTIDSYAFADCQSLKRIAFPGNFPEVVWNTFERVPNYVVFEYQGADIPKKHLDFTDDLADGLDMEACIQILVVQREILQDDTFSPILVTKLANAEHKHKLPEAAEKYKKDFQTIGFYEISDHVDTKMKECLIQLFKNNAASSGVVPKIIDALTIAATTLNIEPERIVKSFEDKKFRDAIIAMRSCHEGNHFFDCEAALFAMTFDVNTVKQFILENPHKDYASVLLCKGYKTGDEKYLNMAKWIAYHPDSSREMIEKLYKCQDYVEVRPDMTVDQARAQVSCGEGELEIRQIEDRYDGKFAFKDCVCNLSKTEVELGRYKAYIMDGQDPRQVMLGYDTNCCQHLGGAGETAMMYGLANPDAGFFVIEDKETGKILAQAEVWSSKCGPQPDEDRYTGGYDDDMIPWDRVDDSVLACAEYDYIMAHGDPEDFLLNTLGLYKEQSEDGRAEYYVRDEDALCLTGDEEDQFYITPDGSMWLCERICKNPLVREDFNLCLTDMRLGADGQMHQLPDEDMESVLVFDNIEFANDRQIDQFAPIIAKWCETSPYQNIIMGNGYNAMENNGLRKAEPVVLPMDKEWLRLMDDTQEIEKMNEKNGTDFVLADDAYDLLAHPYVDPTTDAIDMDDFFPYTDADESCSALKMGGRVEPYLEKMYGEYCNRHPKERTIAVSKKEEKAEKERHTGRGR